MALICYILATILFAVAGFDGGLEASPGDFIAFGLAFFSLGHVAPGGWPVGPPRG
jgi:hypothetical protein